MSPAVRSSICIPVPAWHSTRKGGDFNTLDTGQTPAVRPGDRMVELSVERISTARETLQAPANFRCWKHSLQKTGRPWVGRNGTVVSLPHAEQVAWVSTRSRLAGPELDRFARDALHDLHRLGSFLNCLSAKNNCSPAVQMNSSPQSTHLRLLSWNSIGRHLVVVDHADATRIRVGASSDCAFAPAPAWPDACHPASDRRSAF